MKIKDNSKFIKIILASIFVFFLMLSYSLINAIIEFVDISFLEKDIQKKEFLHKLTKELSYERDISTVYLLLEKDSHFFTSSENDHKGMYHKSIQNSNKLIIQNEESLKDIFATQENQKFINLLRELPKVRSQIKNQNISFNELFFSYFAEIMHGIDKKIHLNQEFLIDAKLSIYVELLSNIYSARENSELERGYISRFISTELNMKDTELKRWLQYSYGSDSRIFEHNILLFNDSLNEFAEISELMKKNFEELFRMRTQILSSANYGNYSTSIGEFFTETSHKIELLYKTELLVIDHIKDRLIILKELKLSFIIINILILIFIATVLFVTFRSLKNFEENLRRIREAFYSSLGSEILNRRLDILIRKFEKHDDRDVKERESFDYFAKNEHNIMTNQENEAFISELPQRNLSNIQLTETEKEVNSEENKIPELETEHTSSEIEPVREIEEIKEESKLPDLTKPDKIDKQIEPFSIEEEKTDYSEIPNIHDIQETLIEDDHLDEPEVITQSENSNFSFGSFTNLTNDEKKLLEDMNSLLSSHPVPEENNHNHQYSSNSKYNHQNFSFNNIPFHKKILLITNEQSKEDFFSDIFNELRYEFKTIKNTQNIAFDIHSGVYGVIFIDAQQPDLRLTELRGIINKINQKILIILISNSENDHIESENEFLADDILIFNDSKIVMKHIIRTKINDFIQNIEE